MKTNFNTDTIERKKVDAQLIDHCIDRFTELRLIKILGTEQPS